VCAATATMLGDPLLLKRLRSLCLRLLTHKADVKSFRSTKLAELDLTAAVESQTETEATVELKTNVELKLC
jgi:hypothetical protein